MLYVLEYYAQDGPELPKGAPLKAQRQHGCHWPSCDVGGAWNHNTSLVEMQRNASPLLEPAPPARPASECTATFVPRRVAGFGVGGKLDAE